MAFNFKIRLRAFGWHLLASLCVAVLAGVLVFFVWYPRSLAEASGVNEIFLLLLAVDVSIGPIITFAVFNPAKKSLKRDLAVVALLQLSALVYGMHAVAVARPAFIVFNVDRFDLVYANDLSEEALKQARDPDFDSLPLAGPRIVGARLPATPEEQKALIFESLAGGPDLPQLPRYYAPYAALKDVVIKKMEPLAQLEKFNEAAAFAKVQAKYAQTKKVGYLPLHGKIRDLTVIVSGETAEVLEIVALNPW